MTQELVIGALLTGLVGLIWAMTVSVLWAEHPVRTTSEREESTEQEDGVKLDKTAERHTIAA